MGCGLQRPQVGTTSLVSSQVPHTGTMLQSCSGCHATARPAQLTHEFAHSASIAQVDCVSCHMAVPANVGITWSGAFFTHTSSLASCAECHAPQIPASSGPFIDASGNSVPSFNHLTQATGDCAACHQKALTNMTRSPPVLSWSETGSSYPGTFSALTGTAQGSTDYTVTSDVPTWGGTIGSTITAVSSLTQAIPQTMNHNSVNISAATLANCASCHADAASGSFRPGYYHASSLSTPPSTCADCHGAGTLASTGAATNGMPAGFVGAAGAGRNPASPEMNHFANAWQLTNGSWARTSTPAYNQDCAVCHNQPGSTWSGANFHTSLTSGSIGQPASCLDCHANNRPTGAVPTSPSSSTPTQFDHANGMGDCASCHAAPTNSNTPSASLWANGSYHANAGSQTSCNGCHNSQRPTGTTGWIGLNSNAPFYYAGHGNGLDCATCHGGTTQFTSMSGWSGGFFAHSSTTSSCLGCHVIPDPSWYPSATGAGVAGGYTHAAGSDCAGCHSAALQNVITQGRSPALSAWAGTGQSGVPSGLVGDQSLSYTVSTLNSSSTPVTSIPQVKSVSSSSTSFVLSMLHSSSAIPAGMSSGGTLVCSKCHSATSISNSYRGGVFHSSITAAGLSQPTTCKDCHISILPTGIVGSASRYLNHAAPLSNGSTPVATASDCATCHSPSTAGQSGAWGSSGYFHGKLSGVTPSSCTTCHYLDASPYIGAVLYHMNHGSTLVTQDCTTCHAQPTATQISASGYPQATLWSGGIYHGKIASQPTSCNDCHSGDRPGATTQSLVDTTSPTLEYMNHASQKASGDCATCHLAEVKNLAAGTSPTAFSRTDSFHSSITSGVSTCAECHGLGNGSTVAGTGNTIPGSPMATSNASSVGNSGTTITPAYSPPAAGQPIYDFVSHTDANVTGHDCSSCHTVPAANAGSDYAQWQKAKFHTNVTTVNISSGKCANCHYNIMPNASFTTYNHTQLISSSGTISTPAGQLTSDCSSCHTTNIGTSWLGASVTSPHTATFLQTASCVTCHVQGGTQTYSGSVTSGTAVGMPTGMITVSDSNGPNGTYNLTFYHVSPASVTGSQGTVTIKGSYNLNGTACIYCHSSAANNVVVAASSTNIIAAAPGSGATGWSGGTMGYGSGGTYNHYLAPTSYTYTSGSGITASSGGSIPGTCSACHENARPSGHNTGKDCAGCHSPGSKW